MTVNEEIKEILREYNISVPNALGYLTNVYFNIIPSYIPKDLIQKVHRTKIIEAEGKFFKWNIPLFSEQVTGFEWVSSEWMKAFGEINKERKGTKSEVTKRMKKFFVENPDVRKDEVLGATKLYFNTLTNPKFLKKSDKFIFEGQGVTKTSLLKEWVERYRELKSENLERTSLTNTMK